MIPHNRPTLGEREAQAAAGAVASGYVARGPNVRAFERELCAYLELPEGCAALVSSGTAALYLALRAVNAPGSPVAMPAYVCSALRNAAGMAGMPIRLVDCAPESPNLDVDAVLATDCTAAIVPHMYGVPADTGRLATLAVIDDAAQAIGARVAGTPAGTTGRVGVFSFYATKLMTTGGMGGAVVSADPALIASVQDYLDFDCRRDEQLRFNFQIGEIAAAVGRVQLKRLPEFLTRRAEIYDTYRATGVTLLDSQQPGLDPVRYRAIVRTGNAQELVAHLHDAGVQAIVPTEDWELPAGEFPRARALARSTVSLPIYPSLRPQDVRAVADALQRA